MQSEIQKWQTAEQDSPEANRSYLPWTLSFGSPVTMGQD